MESCNKFCCIGQETQLPSYDFLSMTISPILQRHINACEVDLPQYRYKNPKLFINHEKYRFPVSNLLKEDFMGISQRKGNIRIPIIGL
jgi:hypothetical protein